MYDALIDFTIFLSEKTVGITDTPFQPLLLSNIEAMESQFEDLLTE